MSHVACLPFALNEHPVAADAVETARLLGQKFMVQHPDLGLIKVRMVKAAAAFTACKNQLVKWSDDDNYTVVYTTEVTDLPCGVIPPDISADIASGDLHWVIVAGRFKHRNEDSATIAAGNSIIPAATDGLTNDGGTTTTPRLDFARAIEAVTANGQTKIGEIIGELVG